MAAIGHAFTEQTTNQTTGSTTYVDVPGGSLASGNFTAGKKYLLVVQGHFQRTPSVDGALQVAHGGTAFADSECIMSSTSDRIFTYVWLHVWTAVSGEAITLQFKTAATGTAEVDCVSMLAIKLSDDLVENTDWFFAEDGVDAALTTAGVDGASLTFTPGAGGDDWLVMVYSQITPGGGGNPTGARIVRSGEAASSLPQTHMDMSATGRETFWAGRVFNLGISSNTFKEQGYSIGVNAGTRLHSKVFAINMAKFKDHASAYTEAGTALSVTDYATLAQTVSLTPSVAADVWCAASFAFDKNDALREIEVRLQIDNADAPAGQTVDNYQFYTSGQNSDEDSVGLSALKSLSAASHTLDVDASTEDVTGAPAAAYRSAWMLSMELRPVGVSWLPSYLAIGSLAPTAAASGMTPPDRPT